MRNNPKIIPPIYLEALFPKLMFPIIFGGIISNYKSLFFKISTRGSAMTP